MRNNMCERLLQEQGQSDERKCSHPQLVWGKNVLVQVASLADLLCGCEKIMASVKLAQNGMIIDIISG